MKKFLIFLFLITTHLAVFADQYVPEFDKMQTMRCEISETIYSNDNSIVSSNQYHRIYRFDDNYNRMYLQKEPISNISLYSKEKVEFFNQSMTDDFIIYSSITIDRINNKYTSESRIIYDNPEFSARSSKAQGICKILE